MARLIQFIHPGGEPHLAAGTSQRPWNRGPHERCFLQVQGASLASSAQPNQDEGELLFWGQWDSPAVLLRCPFSRRARGEKPSRRGGERRVAGDSGGGRGDGGERRAIVAADSGTAVRRWLDGMRRHFSSAGNRWLGSGGDREMDFPVFTGGLAPREDDADGRTAVGRRERDVPSRQERSSWRHARSGRGVVTLGASAETTAASARVGAVKERSPRGRTWQSPRGSWPRGRRRGSAGSSTASSRPGWRRPPRRVAATPSGNRTDWLRRVRRCK